MTISDSLRQLVRDRAQNRCEYCLIPQSAKLFSFEVDHIIAEKHRGATNDQNLCLSCMDCNRHKGSDFASFDPVDNQIALLFNPRVDKWEDHFTLDGALIKPLTPQGRVTAFLLQFNVPGRLLERIELVEAGVYPPKAI